jgi:hypothetical protein
MRYTLFLTLSLFALLTACKEKPKSFDSTSLKGRWEVQSATRNDRSTGMLNGVYFSFSGTNLEHNLPLENEEVTIINGNYQVNGAELIHQSTPPMTYKLLTATTTDLQMSFVYHGMTYVLNLKPGAEPTEMPQDSAAPSDPVSEPAK